MAAQQHSSTNIRVHARISSVETPQATRGLTNRYLENLAKYRTSNPRDFVTGGSDAAATRVLA